MFVYAVWLCRHINYCMHRVNLLRHHGVRPILVFDGGHLPMKTEQENKRARYSHFSLTLMHVWYCFMGIGHFSRQAFLHPGHFILTMNTSFWQWIPHFHIIYYTSHHITWPWSSLSINLTNKHFGSITSPSFTFYPMPWGCPGVLVTKLYNLSESTWLDYKWMDLFKVCSKSKI